MASETTFKEGVNQSEAVFGLPLRFKAKNPSGTPTRTYAAIEAVELDQSLSIVALWVDVGRLGRKKLRVAFDMYDVDLVRPRPPRPARSL